jgi:Ser/Thr protein kinase RdoA (MazF antagonist)
VTTATGDAAEALRAARAFALGATPQDASPLGEGHIHGTWRVDTDASRAFVLQRLNEDVFPAIEDVVENVARVTLHLREKLPAGPATERRCLQLVPTTGGGWLHRDATGTPWRAFVHIQGTRSFQTVPDAATAREAARSFGAFAVACADLSPDALHVPLPGFHDFDARRRAFEAALREDACNRARKVAAEADAFAKAAGDLAATLRTHDLPSLPNRVVHNDCKLNNVLFDADRLEALCVIDLDTVMPGLLMHDFGDLGRTAACALPEDSRELERVAADPELLAAVTAGYAEATQPIATPEELALFPLAGPLITLETGLRFLTDHLQGDGYFGATRPGQNLDRARMQLRLYESLLSRQDVVRRALDRA